MIFIILTGVAMLELSTAQVFSYMPRNVMAPANLQGNQNLPANNVRTLPNNGIPRAPNALNDLNYNQVANNYANVQRTNSQLANNQIAAAQLANTQMANAANNQIGNAHILNNADRQIATQRIAATNELANLANANIEAIAVSNLATIGNNVASNFAELSPNFVAGNPNLAAFASNLASINGNMATFNIGNGGNTFTVTSGSPNSPAFGIQVLADALEVGGTVAVNGQIPIFGTVAVNGNLPTDGTAAVSYTCGRQGTV